MENSTPFEPRTEDFVSPKTGEGLAIEANFFVTASGDERYPIESGIPIFYRCSEWDTNYASHPIYKQTAPLESDTSYFAEFFNEKQGGVFLDLGCGDGVYSANFSPETTVYCADVSPVALLRVQMREKANLIPLAANATAMPFSAKFFDLILCMFMIEHVPYQTAQSVMKECYRLLKADGQLVYVTDTPFYDKHLKTFFDLLVRFKLRRKHDSKETGHINLLTLEQSRQLGRELGFSLVREKICWYGSRNKAWSALSRLLRTCLPRRFCEDYLSSSYTLVFGK